MDKIKIDIVIPVYNEADDVEAMDNGLFLVLMMNGIRLGMITKGCK
jgi:hypothetical protein